jgi:polysaccharide pyruvyl transferase WcaK-like protein
MLPRRAVAPDDRQLRRDRLWATSRARKPAGPIRVGLFGLFGCGNSGNDGSLEAMVAFLREARPEADLLGICAPQNGAAKHVAESLGIPTTSLAIARPEGRVLQTLDRFSLRAPRHLASLLHATWQTARLDLLVIPGTGMLDDFGDGPAGMPLALFGWCLAARAFDTKIAFVSIGAGPIHHPVSRWLMRSAVAMAGYRSYRDSISKAFLDSIGLDTRSDPVYPDLAFRLPAPDRAACGDSRAALTIGVGVMTYRGWRKNGVDGIAIYQAYLEKLTTFVRWLLDRGHAVRILMGDAADQRAANDLLENIGAARPDLPGQRLAFEPISSLHDLMRQIAETDVVVATRYHNVVCALKLGKPTVSIGYAEKNDVLMAEMGLGSFCQHVERLNVDLLIEQFTQLVADRERHERRIEAVNLAYRERLERQDSILASRFLGNRPAMQADSGERHQ